jgi:hypothetical protein
MNKNAYQRDGGEMGEMGTPLLYFHLWEPEAGMSVTYWHLGRKLEHILPVHDAEGRLMAQRGLCGLGLNFENSNSKY